MHCVFNSLSNKFQGNPKFKDHLEKKAYYTGLDLYVQYYSNAFNLYVVSYLPWPILTVYSFKTPSQ